MKTSKVLVVSGAVYIVIVCYLLSGENLTVFVWLLVILTIPKIIGIAIGSYAVNESIKKMFDDGEEGNDR